MTERIPGDRLNRIFGFESRFKHVHVVRLTAADKKTWMLHAQDCLDKYSDDLRECEFALAQDKGVDELVWEGYTDENVIVAIDSEYGDLIPVSRMGATETPETVEKDWEVQSLIRLARARVGEDFSIISHGDVGEPSNGALMKRLATLVEELWETSPTSPAT